MIDSRRQRFLTVLFPALLAPLQLFLFGPHTLFMANQQEFSATFWSLALHMAPMILVLAAVLSLLGVLLPKRFFTRYLVAIGSVLWIQGNLMVGDYGVLNGQDIEWSGHAWRNRYELALWLTLPVVAVVFAHTLFSTAVFASRVLIALQLVLLTYTAVQADPEAQAKWEGPPEAIFE